MNSKVAISAIGKLKSRKSMIATDQATLHYIKLYFEKKSLQVKQFHSISDGAKVKVLILLEEENEKQTV